MLNYLDNKRIQISITIKYHYTFTWLAINTWDISCLVTCELTGTCMHYMSWQNEFENYLIVSTTGEYLHTLYLAFLFIEV